MGYYALAGKETESRLRSTIRGYMTTDINKRRDYVKTLTMGATQTDKVCKKMSTVLITGN